MKFSACILTAGLLLATAATVHSSFLNPFVKALGVLGADILGNTTACPNPPDAPIGTAQTLTITDCNSANYPCDFEQTKTYNVIPTFTCGAAHSNCHIEVTMIVMGNDVTVFRIPSDPNQPLPVDCTPGKTVSPIFAFTLPPNVPPNSYVVKIKVFCNNGPAQQLEFCCGTTIVVPPSP